MRILLTAAFLTALAAGAGAETPAFPGDAETGWVYAQQHCFGCHPQNGKRNFKEIGSQPGMTGTALIAWLTASDHRDMPHLLLKPDEARNVVAYILSLQEAPRK
jgi:mono/diheme cytochrome c family protein